MGRLLIGGRATLMASRRKAIAKELAAKYRSVRRETARCKNLHQPALLYRRADKGGKQRMRLERARLELGVELDADEPGMILILDHFRQQAVGRHAGKPHPVLL